MRMQVLLSIHYLIKRGRDMSVFVILFLLSTHWIADFALQTGDQATKKSSSNYWLTQHLISYSAFWALALVALTLKLGRFDLGNIVGFTSITFVCHWCTDWVSSRVNKWLWDKKEIHYFFVSIGFDQLLHFFQLIITYKLIFG